MGQEHHADASDMVPHTPRGIGCSERRGSSMEARSAFDRAHQRSTTCARWELGEYCCHADWNGIYWAVTVWRGNVWQHIIWCYDRAKAAAVVLDTFRMLMASKGERCLSMELTLESRAASWSMESAASGLPSSSSR